MIEIRPLDTSPSGIEATSKLLKVVYPHARQITPSYLERLYFGNPLGPTTGVAAWEDGQLVAHYLMVPLKTRVFGREEMGIGPFQLATHPAWRGRGLFTRLAETVMERSREEGFGFLVGVGNHQSSSIFVRKWGYQAICQLDVKVGIGRIPLPNQALDDDLELVRIWDRESLAWRLQLGNRPYRVQLRGEQGLIFADTGRLGFQALMGSYPREWLPDDMPAVRTLRPLRLWMGVDPTRSWLGAPYLNLPERLKPSPLILLFCDLTDRGRRFDPSKVRYDGLDFDAY